MAEWPGIYRTGTASVEAGSKIVTFQSAGSLSQAVREGDRFGSHVGSPIRIAAIDGATATLAYPWAGPSQVAAPYEIAFTPYDSGYRQALQILLGGININIPQLEALLESMPAIEAVDAIKDAIEELAAVADDISALDAAAVSAAAAQIAQIQAVAANLPAITNAIAAAESAGSFDTRADALAALASLPENKGLYVEKDPAPVTLTEGNGLYAKRGGQLVKISNATLGAVFAILNLPAALVASGLAAATQIFDLKTELAGADLIGARRLSDGKLLSFSKDALTAWIESIAMGPPTTKHNVSKTVGTTPSLVVGALNEGERFIELYGQVASDAPGRVAFGLGGVAPAINGLGSATFSPGQFISITNLPNGPINALAEGGDAKVSLWAVTTQVSNPNLATLVAQHWARYTGTYTTAEQSAIKNLWAALFNSGILAKATGHSFGIFVGKTDADRLLNWGGSGAVGTLVSAPAGNIRGYTFDGVDDAILLPQFLSVIVDPANHTEAVYTSETVIQGSSRHAFGDLRTRIQPLRSETNIATQSLNTSANVGVFTGANGLVGLTRTSLAGYTAFRNAEISDRSTVVGTVGSTQVVPAIGAINTATGLTNFFQGRILSNYLGAALTDAERAAMRAAFVAYEAAVAGL